MNCAIKCNLGGLAALILCAYGIVYGDACTDLQDAKRRIYGFRPSELTEEQRNQKSVEIDGFWNLAKSKGGDGVVCLREIILAEKEDGFFLFDASSLLYSLEPSEASHAAIAHGLSNTDLGEVDSAAYIRFVIHLSHRGFDIGTLAERYLKHPNVDTYLPVHGGMKLDREMGALLLYGSMAPALADKYLAAALQAEEPYACSAAALVLSFHLTETNLKVLSAISSLDEFPPAIRNSIQAALNYSRVSIEENPKYSRQEVVERLEGIIRFAEELSSARTEDEFEKVLDRYEILDLSVAGDSDFESSAIANLAEEDVPLLMNARAKLVSGVSDEALYEYLALSKILLGVINRLDLHKQYRIH